MSPQLIELASDLRARNVPVLVGPDFIEITSFNNSEVWVLEIRMWAADPSVPVLYFTVYAEADSLNSETDSTRVLGLRELDLREVVIGEHPRTGMPVLFVHPCNTRAWLADTGASMFLWLTHFVAMARIPLHLE